MWGFMASKTEIANRALSKLGQPRVSNIDTDGTKAANTIRYMWDMTRDALLMAYPWNFSIQIAQLAADAEEPLYGYTTQYSLPSDCLSLLEIDNNPEFRFVQGKIHTSEAAPLNIKYIARMTNPGSWDALFNEAFASRLAYEACEEITQSNSKKQILANDFANSIRLAYANNAIQIQQTEYDVDEWLAVRNMYVSDDLYYRL